MCNLNQTLCFLFVYLLLPETCILFDMKLMKLSAFVRFLGALRLLLCVCAKTSWHEICEYGITVQESYTQDCVTLRLYVTF